MQIKAEKNHVAGALLRVSELFATKKWANGKLLWVRQTNPEVISRNRANLYGSEYDFFVSAYGQLQESTSRSICSHPECPDRIIERNTSEIVLL